MPVKHLITWLFFLSTLCVFAQDVGSTKKEVLAVYGEPQMQRESSNGTIWVYSNGTRLVISEGIVIETNVSAKQAPPLKSEVKSTYTTRTLEPPPSPPASKSAQNDRPPGLKLSPLAVVLLIVGMLISLISSIWFIIVTFQTSMGWGICCLFVPLASLIFLFAHWDVSKKPFLLSLASIIPGGIGYAMMLS